MYLKTSKSTCNVPIDRSARTKLHDSKFASSTSLWNIIFISCTTHSGTASSALPGSHPWRATPRQSQVMVSNWTTGGLMEPVQLRRSCWILEVPPRPTLWTASWWQSTYVWKMARSLKCMVATTVIFWTCGFFRLTWPSPGNDFLTSSCQLETLRFIGLLHGITWCSSRFRADDCSGHDAYVFWRFWRSTKINEQRGGSVSWTKY